MANKSKLPLGDRLRKAAHGNTDHTTHHDGLSPHCALCSLLAEAADALDTLEAFAARTSDEKMLLLREARETQQSEDAIPAGVIDAIKRAHDFCGYAPDQERLAWAARYLSRTQQAKGEPNG